MKRLLAILIGKIIHWLTRMLKIGGGSAAPGLYALKIYPNLVEDLVKQIPKNVVITGTNGKTTTARMLDYFSRASGLKTIRNHTGSNLERGIASALISRSAFHLGGVRLNKVDLGIWELDEATFNSVAPKINPNVVIFLNVFRDQLDRYGEVDTIINRWCEALKKIPSDTQILINGDDGNLVKLLNCHKGKAKKFGLADYKIAGESSNIIPQKLDFEAKNIESRGISGSSFKLTINYESTHDLTVGVSSLDRTSSESGKPATSQSGFYRDKPLTVNLLLPGIYHIYDFMAAFACGLQLKIATGVMIDSLRDFLPAFGRVEKLRLTPPGWKPEKEGYIFLIKNPTGATQVFETVVPNLKKEDRLLIALNDNLADGTDVSWIWDANFELIQNSPRAKSGGCNIICSGTRALDLALRLKYAGFEPGIITVENSLGKAFLEAKTGLKGKLYILPTYTALLELQHILANRGIKQHYWKEQ